MFYNSVICIAFLLASCSIFFFANERSRRWCIYLERASLNRLIENASGLLSRYVSILKKVFIPIRFFDSVFKSREKRKHELKRKWIEWYRRKNIFFLVQKYIARSIWTIFQRFVIFKNNEKWQVRGSRTFTRADRWRNYWYRSFHLSAFL